MSGAESTLPGRPHPEPPPEHRPYWEGLRAHRLVLQRCARCHTWRHYPRPMCANCYAMEHTWVAASGRGQVHTWSVSHHAFHPAFKRDLPYATVTVDLEEGVRAHAPFRGDATLLAIGLPVVMRFEDVDAELTLPCFVAAP